MSPSSYTIGRCSTIVQACYIGLMKVQRKVTYYTIEIDPLNLSVIGGYNSDGGHLNYALSPESQGKELLQLQSYFMQGLGLENCNYHFITFSILL